MVVWVSNDEKGFEKLKQKETARRQKETEERFRDMEKLAELPKLKEKLQPSHPVGGYDGPIVEDLRQSRNSSLSEEETSEEKELIDVEPESDGMTIVHDRSNKKEDNDEFIKQSWKDRGAKPAFITR